MVKGELKRFHTGTECQDKKDELSQLDHIIGPMKIDEIYIHNAGRLWTSWDHYPVFARIHEEPHIKSLSEKNAKMHGMEADNRRSINPSFEGGDEKRRQ